MAQHTDASRLHQLTTVSSSRRVGSPKRATNANFTPSVITSDITRTLGTLTRCTLTCTRRLDGCTRRPVVDFNGRGKYFKITTHWFLNIRRYLVDTHGVLQWRSRCTNACTAARSHHAHSVLGAAPLGAAPLGGGRACNER
jgi:hypothetical protein